MGATKVTPYDDKETCVLCGGRNNIGVIDNINGTISECDTYCDSCGHTDFWAYGFFMSRSEPPLTFMEKLNNFIERVLYG